MTFIERYQQSQSWQEKALIMEIFHLAMLVQNKNWTVTKTAESFGVSVGLASENLRLAAAIHSNEKLAKSQTRQEALKGLNGYR